ncbi:MAG: pitrilysin family protein, partial [Candidatus Aenigmatarchaeota archaeon]
MKKPSLHQLSNGLKVLLYNSFNLTTNSILVLVKTGTDYEDKKNNGISHFLEHIFFKGTKNFPSPQALGFELDKIGAEYNAFTSYEYTGYYIKTLPEYFERGIYLMSDLLINPLFNEEEIEKEKNVILEEINFHKDNPIALIFDETLKTCYGDQPAGWSILGREEVIKKINSEKIKNYFKKHYSSKNSLIVIAGNFDKNKILKTLEKYFKNYN